MSKTNESNGNSTVALVRSSKQYAAHITDEEIRQMVREAVELTGGLSDIIKDGQTVVIKPNIVVTRHVSGNIKPLLMLVSNPFKESVQIPELMNGVTTDRRVTRAMVELVRELNPSGKVYIMECAGDGITSENFRRMGYNHENIQGVDAFIAIGEDGKYRDVDAYELAGVEVKNQQYKNLPKFLKGKYYFDKTYYSADVIISLAVLKNHVNTAVTGGIKNVGLGARPANIYSPKGKTVSAFVINHAWEPINDFIHDYYSAKPVDFVLTDGLEGLQYGNACQGAPSYEEAKMNMRLILASKDAVAIDSVHSCIIGVDPEKVKHLKDLARDGFGEIDTSKITVVCNTRVDEVKKPFSFAGGILGKIYKETPKARYTDFEAPSLSIDDVTIENKTLTAKLSTAPKTTKVEMHIDGKLVDTFTHGFNQIQYHLNGESRKEPHEIAFYAYDKYLNCGYNTKIMKLSEF